MPSGDRLIRSELEAIRRVRGSSPRNPGEASGRSYFLEEPPFHRLNLCDRFDASMCHCAREPGAVRPELGARRMFVGELAVKDFSG